MARDDSALADRLALVLPHLDERQRRVVLGAEATTIGRGGIGAIARAAGVSQPTVSKAVKELAEPGEALPVGRARRAGGGRKRLADTDPELIEALEALVDPATRGDPESPLKWSSKSTRQLAEALAAQGLRVSHVSVGRLLRANGYSLQAAAKTREGRQHPDRDEQFRYLTEQVNPRPRASRQRDHRTPRPCTLAVLSRPATPCRPARRSAHHGFTSSRVQPEYGPCRVMPRWAKGQRLAQDGCPHPASHRCRRIRLQRCIFVL